MKKLKLYDEAESELFEIFLYYAEKDANLAIRFYEEITDSFSHILRQPKIGVAIAHHNREPGYWRGRK